MTLLTSAREVQIPLLAAMLLGAGGTKLVHVLRASSVGEAFGPTAHFPAHLRRPAAVALCVIEFGLGAGLVLTAGRIGAGTTATSIRLATCIFFVIATSALIELRTNRPEVGCGCFGNLSTAPVGTRTLARSALLAIAALATIGLPPIGTPTSVGAVQLVALLVAEMLLIGALSPEIGEGLIRLGYSEPCELRDVAAQRTLAVLRRSRPWRRYSPLITSDSPVDLWRELCWRYVVYPSNHEGRPADLVFAIYLQQRRPAIRAALVDSATGQTVPWPSAPSRRGRVRLRYARATQLAADVRTTQLAADLSTAQLAADLSTAQPAAVRADIPVSTDV